MPSRPTEIATLVFDSLINNGDVDIVSENNECHIIADDWTLVLVGDPISDALVALDDESGEKEAALRDAISDEELETIRSLDGQMDGEVSSLLNDSPDELARALASLILN